MRIAVDAMGGDLGPRSQVRGSISALTSRSDLEVVLLGPKSLLEEQIDSVSGMRDEVRRRLSLENVEEVVGMDESPVEAVRKKKNSTIMVAFSLVRAGKADAVVSAGNSGATMAAAIRVLGRLPGVSRPAIGTFFPTLKKPVMLMDVGANVDCRPQHLLQFAFMSSACSRILYDIEKPRVGLLSIGEEVGKGNALVKETHELLSSSNLNYIGNVEGRDLYRGDVDVVVCDGFVGNVCLKLSESLAVTVLQMLKEEIVKSWWSRMGVFIARGAFKRFRKRVDYAEYGGAPLLGVKGQTIICHGASCEVAIRNAVFVADDMAKHKVNEAIVESIAAYNL